MKKEVLVFIVSLLILTSVVGLVMAVDTDTTEATVTVNEFLSITLTDAPVTFPSMDPGATITATAGTGYPLTVTIDSVSNVDADIGTKADAATFVCDTGTTPSCTGESIPVANMKWDDDIGTPSWIDYTISNVEVCDSVAPTVTCSIYHQLTIPSGQYAGNYEVGITITATATAP